MGRDLGREAHRQRVRHARLPGSARDARRRRDDGRARRGDRAGSAGTLGADRPLPPSADGRAPVRDARRALGRQADHDRRLGLGPAGVRGGRRRLRASWRRHRGVHRDLEARVDGAVARLARPLLQIIDVSLEPKPVQKPHPPIVFGAVTEVGPPRCAQIATAFTRCSSTPTPIPAGSTTCGRSCCARASGAAATCRASGSTPSPRAFTDRCRAARRRTLTGNAEQVLARPRAFCRPRLLARDDALRRPFGNHRRAVRDVERFADEVLPRGRDRGRTAAVKPATSWRRSTLRRHPSGEPGLD